MNIDINDINDLKEFDELEQQKEDNEIINANNNNNNIISDDKNIYNIDNVDDISKKIYSWKTVIQNFKKIPSNDNYTNNRRNNIDDNYLDITRIDLIPCNEAIEISNITNLNETKKEIKFEKLILPNMNEYILNNINTPLFFEPQ
ncbi:hypothetical protein BCR32DRAFT_269091, partial [Anaeromyces robustus]